MGLIRPLYISMGYKDPDKQREYQRKWQAKRRKSFFEGKSCAKCGSTERLELDHIDPTAKTSHNVWSWSKKNRDTELKKCQILCHGCHKEKTRAYLRVIKQKPWEHGTVQGYKYRKCRCIPCRDASNAYRRKLKEKLGYWP